MLIHDAILLEVDSVEQIRHAEEIMLQAGRDTCKGLEIGVDGGDDKDLLLDCARYHGRPGHQSDAVARTCSS
jgi:hypothetical protein